MASKKRTKYSEYYKKYKRKVNQLRKQGIELRYLGEYQTEQTLRRWGISGRDLAKITRQLKKEISTLETHEAFNVETGEISTVSKIKHEKASERAKRSAKTRKENKEAERKFWTGEETEAHLYPQMGDIATQNVYDELIARLQMPVPTDTIYDSHRKAENIKRSSDARSYLQSLWCKVISEEGANVLGERLEKYADIVQQDIDYILNASKGVELTSALHRVARVIKGGELTESEKGLLNDEQEMNSSWDVNDSYYE